MTFWDRFAGVYDIIELTNGKVYREMCAITRRLVPNGATVLDCAAGTGELSFAAAVRAESVLCTDISENMLKTAKKKAAARRKDNISFAERNIFDLQESDNTYDIVIAGNVLHLLDNPQDAVRELYRVLKKGGKLLLPTFVTAGHAE
ncbi:MAG: methyltransferase domain-containing protein, partial [[Eubacterium] saphenum]|nr:methyltransferase domain-containing protein [[Eubacterium] saphenum]